MKRVSICSPIQCFGAPTFSACDLRTGTHVDVEIVASSMAPFQARAFFAGRQLPLPFAFAVLANLARRHKDILDMRFCGSALRVLRPCSWLVPFFEVDTVRILDPPLPQEVLDVDGRAVPLVECFLVG